ncbi:MAG TPA: BON domain-containing protein [Acidiferrobacterales bacterium]|nr:BON domain-containing protein [Acidiferrobacterales bacterium]
MEKMRNVGFLGLFLLVFIVAGCASTRTSESPGEYVDDSVITSRVKTRLIQDQALKAFDIGVETFRGDVLLSGFVDSQDMIDRAVEITKKVPGVKSVRNSLVVKKEKTG